MWFFLDPWVWCRACGTRGCGAGHVVPVGVVPVGVVHVYLSTRGCGTRVPVDPCMGTRTVNPCMGTPYLSTRAWVHPGKKPECVYACPWVPIRLDAVVWSQLSPLLAPLRGAEKWTTRLDRELRLEHPDIVAGTATISW